MKLESISNKIIAIGGAVAIIASTIAYFGFSMDTPREVLDKHVAKSEKEHVAMDVKIDSVSAKAENVSHIEELLEGMLRGECLENPRDNLVRQGLIKKCEELGIER